MMQMTRYANKLVTNSPLWPADDGYWVPYADAERAVGELRTLVETLAKALKLARSRMAHNGANCLRLLPAEEWSAEKGNRDAHCECAISDVDAAILAAERYLAPEQAEQKGSES